MFKKLFAFCLFSLLCIYSSNTFALSIVKEDIIEDKENIKGAFYIPWKESYDTLVQKDIVFEQRDFDRKKKLFTYEIASDDNKSINGVKLDTILYYFWDGKYSAAKAFYDNNKQEDNFNKIYSYIVEKLGDTQKESIDKDTGEKNYFWQGENTGVKLTFHPDSQTGTVYSYSTDLNLEYVEFIKQMPGELPNYPNEAGGFNGFEWGFDLRDFADKKFLANKSTEILGNYLLAKDNKKFLNLNIKRITYEFEEDKLVSGFIYYDSSEKKSIFTKMYDKLVEQHGLPASGRYDATESSFAYFWPSTKTYIVLYHFYNQPESYIFFSVVR